MTDYQVTKKCPYCDTALEFTTPLGSMAFTAHDDQFCAVGTRHRVQLLEQALLSQREAYERKIERYNRGVDEMLKKHGLPTMREQAEEAALRAQITRSCAVLEAIDFTAPAYRALVDEEK